MLSQDLLLKYIIAATLLAITPGSDTMYVIARATQSGRRGGLISVLGIVCGEFAHIAAAAIGVSALLVASASAFVAVKLLGAAYLAYLGIKTLLTKDPGTVANGEALPELTYKKLFWQGAVTNALNPKVAIFFVAFVPNFADPALGHFWLQIVLLGMIHQAIGIVWLSIIAIASGSLAAFKDSAKFRTFQKYFSGSVLLLLGGRLLTLQRSTR